MLSMNIGELVKFKREYNNLSVKKLAELVNVSTSYIYKLEKNEIVPSLKVFSNLCRALNFNSLEILWLVRACG